MNFNKNNNMNNNYKIPNDYVGYDNNSKLD